LITDVKLALLSRDDNNVGGQQKDSKKNWREESRYRRRLFKLLHNRDESILILPHLSHGIIMPFKPNFAIRLSLLGCSKSGPL
jgi:hypothetical protein